MVKMLEAYCRRFPADRLTVMCTANSPLASLGAETNCDVEIVGRSVPRELHLLGLGDIAMNRLHRKRHFDVLWTVNVGFYLSSSLPQVLAVNNSHQVYPATERAPHPASRLRVWMLRFLFRRSLRLSSAAIVQTGLMKRYLRAIPGCPSLVGVVPKAVVSHDDREARPLSDRLAEQLAKAGESTKLLYVATCTPHKNHKVLAGVMEQFRERKASVALAITLSSEEWVRMTGDLGQRLLNSGSVLPLGWVDKDELEALYGACDVCVMPSLLESLSSSHIEAMRWKRPQVAADLPYAHDLCGSAALYAAPNDPLAWCEQVGLLLTDRQVRNNLIQSGLQRLSAFPENWSVMAEGIRDVLVEAVSRSGNAGEEVI